MYSIIDRLGRFKENMFALIIGIDDYDNCRKLRGAVADAKAMQEYLEQDLQVPRDHIRTLFNRDATRSAIVQTFQELQKDERIREGNPIVIFYAGHGGELPTPSTWTWWAPESKIQCLLSQDFKDSDTPPIPDRTIGSLIEGVARVKGDNISVIFDCCHSASGTRALSDGYAGRTVKINYIIPEDLDEGIWGDRAGKIHPGFSHHGLQSHVLLAACGEDELAYEYEGRGQFTTALLKVLRSNPIDDLTYTEVLENIHLTRQNPHCEGFNQHRIIFDARVPAGRQVLHSVQIESSGKYIFGAGLAHGVAHGVEFTLYNERKRSVGVVVVNNAAVIEDFQTTVSTSVLHDNAKDALSAKLTRVGNLPVYLSKKGDLPLESMRMEEVNGTSAPTFRLVEEVKDAKLEIVIENNLAILKVLDQQLERFGLTDLSFKITLDRLTQALGAAAHYYWYLDLKNDNNRMHTRGVTVDFYLLQESEKEFDDYGILLLVPVEPGFCRYDSNAANSDVIDFVVDPDALYGIKITNDTTKDLYLNAFLFNNSTLSIAPYYIQPSGNTPRAPLGRNATFTIGYGPGGTAPFTYLLEEGQDVDVGYLKIFFAAQPIDLTDIVQPPPFAADVRPWIDEDGRKARMNAVPPVPLSRPEDTWFTFDIPVVQRRGKTVVRIPVRSCFLDQ